MRYFIFFLIILLSLQFFTFHAQENLKTDEPQSSSGTEFEAEIFYTETGNMNNNTI